MLNKETIEEINTLRQTGLIVTDIAKRLGIARSTVSKYLDRPRNKSHTKRLLVGEIEGIKRCYVDGDTLKSIAKRYGVHIMTVQHHTKDLPRRVKHTQASVVYVIQIENTQRYKIGVTYDVRKRLSILQTGNAFELSIVYELKTKNARETESHLHRRFASKRIRGEWFELSDADIEYIKTL